MQIVFVVGWLLVVAGFAATVLDIRVTGAPRRYRTGPITPAMIIAVWMTGAVLVIVAWPWH